MNAIAAAEKNLGAVVISENMYHLMIARDILKEAVDIVVGMRAERKRHLRFKLSGSRLKDESARIAALNFINSQSIPGIQVGHINGFLELDLTCF